MHPAQYIRFELLKLLAAQGDNPIPQPTAYWHRHLVMIAGNDLTIDQTEAELFALVSSYLVHTKTDAIGLRRWWITAAGQAAAQ